MRLDAKEPEFSLSTIILGEEISRQLIEGSRRARPAWDKLFQENAGVVENLMCFARSELHFQRHPLVDAFMSAWAQNIPWGMCDSGCLDAIGIKVPITHLESLAKYGGVESFSLMLGHMTGILCATLGNNDHNREFGLIVNCPAWLELGSLSKFSTSFEDQLRMIIQHEMAHFRNRGSGVRSETTAHCRGIASVLWRQRKAPTSIEELIRDVQDFPEIAQNDEMKRFVLNGGEAPWRLVRLWLYFFNKHGMESEPK